ncbi:unnamed protein product, partial [Rotaria sp. Silwood1]
SNANQIKNYDARADYALLYALLADARYRYAARRGRGLYINLFMR